MKSSMHRNLITVASTIILVAFCISVWAAAKIGAKAPKFKLPSITGKTISLNQIRKDPKNKKNRVVVLVFWATWCPGCREETAYLQRLHEKYGTKGMAVVSVAMDIGGAKDVKPFAEEHKLTYTLLVDPNNKVTHPLYRSAHGIPATFILDRKGIIRYHHVGLPPGFEKQLNTEVELLLKQ